MMMRRYSQMTQCPACLCNGQLQASRRGITQWHKLMASTVIKTQGRALQRSVRAVVGPIITNYSDRSKKYWILGRRVRIREFHLFIGARVNFTHSEMV